MRRGITARQVAWIREVRAEAPVDLDEALRLEPPIDWDTWIDEGLQASRQAEAAGYRREAAQLRAYVEKRTGRVAEVDRCVAGKCRLPRIDAPWCHRCAPVFAAEPMPFAELERGAA